MTASQNTRIPAVKCMVSLRKGYMNKPEAMANINRHTNAEGQESRRVPPLDTEQQGINEKREKERETASPRGEPLIGYATQGLETILIQTIKMDSGDCIFIIVWGVHMWMRACMHESIIIKDKETINLRDGSGSCEELEGGKRRENVSQSYFN